jgi:polyhydroxybutyrate depolymerase
MIPDWIVRRNERLRLGCGARTCIPGGAVRPAVGCVLALAFALFALPEPAGAASGRISIESGGTPRTAIIVQHRRLKQARRPLVIVLRSSREKGPRLKRIFGLEEMTGSAGPVLVYPEPAGGHWSDAPGSESARDAAFIRDLIAKLASDGLVDRRKVFIVGISNGGFTAFRILCENASLFAGAAALITAIPADLAETCKPSRPVPLIMIAGTADPMVPYAGGKVNFPDARTSVLSADASLAIFARAAGCGEGRVTTPIPDRDTKDGTRAYLDKLNGCKVPVELLRVEGGGHSVPGHWPGAESSRGGLHNKDFESARLIWDFFRGLGA